MMSFLKNVGKRILTFIDYQIVPFFGWICISKNKYVNVIYYHDIVTGDGSKYMRTNIDVFKQQMQYLVDNNYETLRFDDLDNLEKIQFKKRRVLIAFDDGWRSNYEKIFSWMNERGLKYNVFLTIAEINHNPNYLTWEMVDEMHKCGLCGFGAHTLTHPSMKDIKIIDTKKEIEEANNIFENKLGYAPKDFCYPFGYYSEESNVFLEQNTSYERIYTSKMLYSYKQNGKLVFGRNGISNSYPMHYYVKKLKGWINVRYSYDKYIHLPFLFVYHLFKSPNKVKS